jgi:hypothetical protein
MFPSKLEAWLLAAAFTLAAVPALAKPPAPPAVVWEQVVPASTLIGVDGKDYHPSCSALPRTDPTFKFWARRTGSDKLVVYFEGGGACWDNLTCSFPIGSGLPPPAPQFYVPAIPPGTNPAAFNGIFRSDRPDNPVRDWNFVYIPYCSGDIHTGSASRTYANVGNPLLPPSFTLQHRGFDNFMGVLGWMKDNLGKPKEILVAGSSAGGYGATANFPWIEESFKTAHVSVIADASQGVTTPAFDAGNPGRNAWNPQLAPWAFGPDPNLIAGSALMRVAALAYPHTKVVQFSTAVDAVQIGFYGVMKQSYGPGGSCPNAAVDWNQQMLATLTSDAEEVPNLRYYLAAGTYHTILRSPLFYTEASDGVPFADWVANMLKNRGGTGGHGGGWFDVACPECLTPLPCQ